MSALMLCNTHVRQLKTVPLDHEHVVHDFNHTGPRVNANNYVEHSTHDIAQ